MVTFTEEVHSLKLNFFCSVAELIVNYALETLTPFEKARHNAKSVHVNQLNYGVVYALANSELSEQGKVSAAKEKVFPLKTN